MMDDVKIKDKVQPYTWQIYALLGYMGLVTMFGIGVIICLLMYILS